LNKAKVVAISGTSGCGKTTVINLLAKKLACPYLLFDDYVDEFTYPEDMKNWLRNGADVSEIKTEKLASALRDMLENTKCDYIFVEEPFGKERDVMSELIDYVVLLDQPMEICLARIISRSIANPLADSLTLLPKYLANYEDHFRDCYIAGVKPIRNNCDLSVEECFSAIETVNHINHWLLNQIK